MMSEATSYRLSDVIEIIGGGTPKKKVSEYWSGDIPWLSVVDFNSDERFVDNTAEKITELGLQESSTKLLEAGQVIISARGTVGCLAQLTVPMAFNQSCYGLSGKSGVLDNDYLYYLMRVKVAELQQKTHGAVFDTITRETFNHIEVKIPALSTQKVIAKVLGSFDYKIQLNNQINQTLEQMAQAIFKSWFVDFEPVKAKIAALEAGGSEDDALLAAMQAIAGSALFATDAADADAQTQLDRLQTEHPEQYATLRATAELFPAAMQDSELGEIPEGWEETGFSDWVAIKRGRSITRAKVVPGDVPVVAGGLEPAYYHNEHNVIGPAITISASGANAGYVNLYHQNIWSSDSSYITKQGTPYFYTAYVCLKYYQKAIFDMQTGAAQPHIYPKDFERLKVVVGSDKLLEQLESLLISFFEQSAALKSESESLAQLRDTLLPKLLSGELSVSAATDQITQAEEAIDV